MLPSNPSRVTLYPARRLTTSQIFSFQKKHTTAVPLSSFCFPGNQARVHRIASCEHLLTRSFSVTIRRHQSHWTHGWPHSIGSSWHRPDCTWVSSHVDPISTPRDKQCPACTARTRDGAEMSAKELAWEKKMDRVRRVMWKDSYEAVFGRNGEEVKGVWETMNDGDGKGWWSRRLKPLEWCGDVSGDLPQTGSRFTAGQESTSSATSPPARPKQSRSTREQKTTRNVTATSEPASYPDESVFDPITMRRVPKSSTAASLSAEVTDKHKVVNIAVRTFVPGSTPPGTGSSGTIIKNDTKPQASESQDVKKDSTPSGKVGIVDFHKPLRSESVMSTISRRSTSLDPALLEDQAPKPSLAPLLQQVGAGSPNLAPFARAFDQKIDLPTRHLHAKKELEASWIKEREYRTKISPSTTAHFSRGVASNEGEEENVTYLSNHRRKLPLKHMDSHELGNHRRQLLKSWAKRQHARRNSDTPADQLLSAEINKQKAAMFAFENRPPSFEPLNSSSSSAITQVIVNTATSAKPRSLDSVPAEQHKAEDHALVNDIKSIYENAYGTIRSGSQSDGLKRCLHEYERDLPPGNYDFMMGQDNLELELKLKNKLEEQRLISKSCYEEPRYYDLKMGPAAYTFKMGQDNLEQELKDNAKLVGSVEVPSLIRSTLEVPKKKQEGLLEILGRIRRKAVPVATEPSSAPAPAIKASSRSDNVRLGDLEPLATLGASTFGKLPGRPTTYSSASSASDSQLYTVLAYDPSDNSVHSASASSSYCPPSGEKVLPVSDALMRLETPAKFLPHLDQMQAKGYEIVSANRKLLVLKRVRPAEALPEVNDDATQRPIVSSPVPKKTNETVVEEPSALPLNDSVYTHAPSVGSFALGTGSLISLPRRYETTTTAPGHISAGDIAPLASEASSLTRKSSTDNLRNSHKVRKEEPVFSGTRSRKSTTSTSSSTPNTSSSNVYGYTHNSNTGNKQSYPNEPDTSGDENTGKTLLSALGILALGFGLLYGTGAIVEGMRVLNGPDGPGGPGRGSGSAGSKRAHASFAPGATDRAMWSTVSEPELQDREQERRRHNAIEASAAGQKKKEDAEARLRAATAAAAAAQKTKEEQAKERDVWEKMRSGWFDFDDSVEAAAATGVMRGMHEHEHWHTHAEGEGKDASILAGALGTAVCVASLVALIVGLPGGGL